MELDPSLASEKINDQFKMKRKKVKKTPMKSKSASLSEFHRKCKLSDLLVDGSQSQICDHKGMSFYFTFELCSSRLVVFY